MLIAIIIFAWLILIFLVCLFFLGAHVDDRDWAETADENDKK